MKKLVTYCCACLATTSLFAQAQLQVKTDKDQYLIGDYIHVTITITGNQKSTFFWPEAESVMPFELVSENPIDTVINGSNVILTKSMVVSMYEPGDAYFPQIQIPYQQKNDTTRYVLQSDSIGLRIQGIDVDTTQNIKPILDVLDVSVKKNIWLWIAIGLGALAIIGLAIWYFVLRKKPEVQVVKPERKVTITEKYLVQLQALEERKLWQQDQRKLYYSELTAILRQYIEERFSVSTMEHTSDEIISQASRHPELRHFIADLEYVLSLADMAKFAKSHPLADENIRAMEMVRSFVQQTPVIESVNPEA